MDKESVHVVWQMTATILAGRLANPHFGTDWSDRKEIIKDCVALAVELIEEMKNGD